MADLPKWPRTNHERNSRRRPAFSNDVVSAGIANEFHQRIKFLLRELIQIRQSGRGAVVKDKHDILLAHSAFGSRRTTEDMYPCGELVLCRSRRCCNGRRSDYRSCRAHSMNKYSSATNNKRNSDGSNYSKNNVFVFHFLSLHSNDPCFEPQHIEYRSRAMHGHTP